MHFRLGGIPETPGFLPEAPWKPLREPSPWLMQLFALPVGIVTFVVVGLLWFFLTPIRDVTLDLPALLFVLVIIIPVHELIHALVHPGAGRTSDTILGFWPSRLLFFAHYTGELSRRRFITILLMPLFIISIVPLMVCGALATSPEVIAFGSAMNALFSCGDIFGTAMLLFQIPAKARVRNQGYRTYWRMPAD